MCFGVIVGNLIVCLFNSRRDAEAARDCLLRQGFEDARIRVEGAGHTTVSTADGHATVAASARNVDPGLIGVIERMFSGLLLDNDEVAHYAHAVSNGRYVVALHVADDSAAARAASILHQFSGAITGKAGSDDAVAATPAISAGHAEGRDMAVTGASGAASLSGPRIYPLPNSPTGWDKASLGSKNSIGSAMNDPGRPEGLLRDAKGLGTDTDRLDPEAG